MTFFQFFITCRKLRSSGQTLSGSWTAPRCSGLRVTQAATRFAPASSSFYARCAAASAASVRRASRPKRSTRNGGSRRVNWRSFLPLSATPTSSRSANCPAASSRSTSSTWAKPIARASQTLRFSPGILLVYVYVWQNVLSLNELYALQ